MPTKLSISLPMPLEHESENIFSMSILRTLASLPGLSIIYRYIVLGKLLGCLKLFEITTIAMHSPGFIFLHPVTLR